MEFGIHEFDRVPRWRLMMKTVLRWLDIFVYLVFLVFAALNGPQVATWYLGLCLSIAAVPWWFAARWQLGTSFSVEARARQLVTSGMYSKLRHPVYVFGGLAWFGAVLALMGWQALIMGLVVAVIEIIRARREERVLAAAFGPEYEQYRRNTWF
jgi:protein-S-isoprenylcysteine O-methyltransferase Ste14